MKQEKPEFKKYRGVFGNIPDLHKNEKKLYISETNRGSQNDNARDGAHDLPLTTGPSGEGQM